jgi:hypothetical protein
MLLLVLTSISVVVAARQKRKLKILQICEEGMRLQD